MAIVAYHGGADQPTKVRTYKGIRIRLPSGYTHVEGYLYILAYWVRFSQVQLKQNKGKPCRYTKVTPAQLRAYIKQNRATLREMGLTVAQALKLEDKPNRNYSLFT